MTKRFVIGDDADDAVWLDHEGVRRETDKAKLFVIDGQEVWIPKGQIVDEGDDLVGIPRWLADSKGLT